MRGWKAKTTIVHEARVQAGAELCQAQCEPGAIESRDTT